MRRLGLISLLLASACATTGSSFRSVDDYRDEQQSKLAAIKELRDAIKVVPAPRSAANTLEPYNRMLIEMESVAGLAQLMAQVHPDEALQEAARGFERDLSQLANDINLDRAMFEAVTSVDQAGLDDESKRFRDKVLRDFRRSGVDKDDATRGKLKALFEEMVKIGQDFSKNIKDDQREIRVTVDQLDGLPDDFKRSHPATADGLIVLTTAATDYLPISTYAKNGDVRRQLTEKFLSRGYPQNTEIFKKLLETRHEYATTLGYASWADYQAEDKMIGSGEKIRSFTEEVADISRPRMQRDLDELLVRKKKDDPSATAIENWDRFFYVEAVRAEKYDFDAQEARNYFEYSRVLKGMFELYGELLGLEFTPVEKAVWDPGVKAYEMKSGGQVVGNFYLDMHPRKGKYSHAAMFPIRTGLAGGQAPQAALVCNFPDPNASAEPALMEHQAVVTLFHEFGHLIHHLLARSSRYTNLGGTNVEWDFVEAPSQLLEEWAWSPEVLVRFATHVKTGAPIPTELVAKMKRASEFGKGVHIMRQIYFQALSFYFHAQDPKTFDVERYSKELNAKYSPFPHIEGTHVWAGFGHLEGYSSMYYTYQWSLSLAKDIFTRFSEKGIMDPETARRYRSAVLEPGGMKDARVLVSEFLGREPNLDAYKKWLMSE